MRPFRLLVPILTAVGVAVLLSTTPAAAGDARVTLDFSELSSLGTSSAVNIAIDKQTVEWASKALGEHGGDEAELRDLMKELDGIYVTAFEYDEGHGPDPARLAAVTRSVVETLDSPDWSPVVYVDQRDKGPATLVRVCLHGDAAQPDGLAIFVLEPDQVALVNIVGPVRLEQLARIGRALGKPALLGPLAAGRGGEEVGAPEPKPEAPGRQD
jgi:hypothetical protein